MHEKDLINEIGSVSDTVLKPKDGPLGLSCLVQRRTNLLKQRQAVVQGFADLIIAPERVF